MSTARTPTLFISHGSPMFALDPGALGEQLRDLGEQLHDVKAIVMVSAHWLTQGGVAVSATSRPETIHDFGGFPSALYQLQYPAPGEPALASKIVDLLKQAGFHARLDASRGLDHGAWVPLLYFYPEASIPVLQVSIPYPSTADEAFALGQALAPLRDQGVLIIGSGSLTHNLRDMRGEPTAPAPYVVAFEKWIRERMTSTRREDILSYRDDAPEARRAHPSDDHFLPLLVTLGVASGDVEVQVLESDIRYGALSMESYLIGASPMQAQMA